MARTKGALGRKTSGPGTAAAEARPHVKSAVKVCAGIMNNKKAPPKARIEAAKVILERAEGKASQPIQLPQGGLKTLPRINVTVTPKPTSE